MAEPSEKLTVRRHALLIFAMVLGMAVIIGFPLAVMAAMFGIAWVSHAHLTGLIPWGKAIILVIGLGLTAWTTWSLDPAMRESWRKLAFRYSAWPVYAVFSGSLNPAPFDSSMVQNAVAFFICDVMIVLDLRFRSEPRVLRLRDRLRGETPEQ